MLNELIPVQFVREVLLNIKVSRARLFLWRGIDARGVGNTVKNALSDQKTISMTQTKLLCTAINHSKGKEDARKERKWGAWVAQQFSQCYPRRREAVKYRPEETALWTNKQVFTHTHTYTQNAAENQTKEVVFLREMKADGRHFSRKKRPWWWCIGFTRPSAPCLYH